MFTRFIKNFRNTAVAAVSVVMLGGTAMAAEKTIRIGFADVEGGPYDMAAQTFKKELEASSNGSIEVKVLCCHQMGGEQEMFQKMQLGTLDAAILGQNNASAFFPLMDTMVLPYVFRSYEHAEAVADGPVADIIREKMAAQTGVHMMDVVIIGFRSIINSKRDIKSFDDIAGLRYRVPKNEVMIDTYRAFGADPTPIAWSDTVTAWQTGIVDGGDLGIVFMESQKFSDISKHLAMTEHFTNMSMMFLSDAAYQKLTPQERELAAAASKKASQASRALNIKLEGEAISAMLAKGVVQTFPDKAPFIEASKTVWEDFFEEKGDEFRDFLAMIQAVEG
ncbi:TRAP transporter substrate-binding protein [Roseovarius aestuarii]|nr:TRAP transporter substrate-binding protein [Roseovarius aestuarii]